MSTQAPSGVRSLILPAPGCSLLVPVSVFAELLSYETPQPLAGAPDWLTGTVGWRGVNLPVVSMEPGASPADLQARLAVLWALNDARADRAYAVLVGGVPRVHMATADTMQPAPGESAAFVASYAYVNDERVAIPDLDAMEKALLQVAELYLNGDERGQRGRFGTQDPRAKADPDKPGAFGLG